MKKPVEHEVVQGTLGRYELVKELECDDTSFTFGALDKSGERMFLKISYDPSYVSPWYDAYLEHLREINRRLVNNFYLKESFGYAKEAK